MNLFFILGVLFVTYMGWWLATGVFEWRRPICWLLAILTLAGGVNVISRVNRYRRTAEVAYRAEQSRRSAELERNVRVWMTPEAAEAFLHPRKATAEQRAKMSYEDALAFDNDGPNSYNAETMFRLGLGAISLLSDGFKWHDKRFRDLNRTPQFGMQKYSEFTPEQLEAVYQFVGPAADAYIEGARAYVRLPFKGYPYAASEGRLQADGTRTFMIRVSPSKAVTVVAPSKAAAIALATN